MRHLGTKGGSAGAADARAVQVAAAGWVLIGERFARDEQMNDAAQYSLRRFLR
jgi:hypothetical protein